MVTIQGWKSNKRIECKKKTKKHCAFLCCVGQRLWEKCQRYFLPQLDSEKHNILFLSLWDATTLWLNQYSFYPQTLEHEVHIRGKSRWQHVLAERSAHSSQSKDFSGHITESKCVHAVSSGCFGFQHSPVGNSWSNTTQDLPNAAPVKFPSWIWRKGQIPLFQKQSPNIYNKKESCFFDDVILWFSDLVSLKSKSR